MTETQRIARLRMLRWREAKLKEDLLKVQNLIKEYDIPLDNPTTKT